MLDTRGADPRDEASQTALLRFRGLLPSAIVATLMRLRSMLVVLPLLAVAGVSVTGEASPDAVLAANVGAASLGSLELGPSRTRPRGPAAEVTLTSSAVVIPNMEPVLAETAMPEAEVAPEADELELVRWTVPRRMRVNEVCSNWGMWPRDLRELNPELGEDEWIGEGAQLVVHRRDAHRPTLSIGAPSKGRLHAGIPLPEGPHWTMRDHRPHVFGASNTIHGLLEALRVYGAEDPSAPPIRIGEISARRGGRLSPHVSHRSGRDVDIGYVLREMPEDGRYWRLADEDNLDAARNWRFLKALVATGEVQQVFISTRVQRVLAREAAKELGPDELAGMFDAINRDPHRKTIVSHESGHRDHMHVRFKCEDGNIRCRARSDGGL